MIITRIRAQNFRKYIDLDLSLPQGVIGVIGKNGAGKSTMLELIAWLLYGSPGIKTKNEEVYPDFMDEGGETAGVLDFEVSGVGYHVERSMKSTKSGAMLYAEDNVIASSTKEVNEEVEKITGMDFKAFQTSFYTRQNELNLLGSLRPADRSKRLEEMLGLQRTNVIIDNIKGDLRSLEGEKRGLEQALEQEEELKLRQNTAELLLRDARESIKPLQEKHKELEEKLRKEKTGLQQQENLREEYKTLSSKLAVKQESKRTASERIGELERTIADIESQRERFEQLKGQVAPLDQLKISLEKLEEDRIKHSARADKENQIKELQEILKSQEKRGKDLRDRLEKLQDQSGEIVIINDNIKKLSETLEKSRSSLSDLKVELSGTEGSLKQLEDQMGQIAELGPEAVCSFCLRPFGEEKEDIVGHFESEIEKLKERQKKATKAYNEKSAEIDKLKQEKELAEAHRARLEETQRQFVSCSGEIKGLRDEFKANRDRLIRLESEYEQVKHVEFDDKRFLELKKRVGELTDRKSELARIGERLSGLEKLKAEYKNWSDKTAIIIDNIKEVEEEISRLEFSEDKYKEIRARFEKLEESYHQTERELAENTKQIAVRENDIKNISERLTAIHKAREKIKQLSGQIVYLHTLIDLLKELKTYLAQRIRPTLAALASNLLDYMSDGKFSELELNPDYDILIRDYGELCELNRFSGGEQDLANLSLRLAISRLLAQNSLLEKGFLILDEVFGSQDNFRKENIMGAIAGLQDFFKQIFIVTHVEDIKEAVQTLITIEETPQGSSLITVE